MAEAGAIQGVDPGHFCCLQVLSEIPTTYKWSICEAVVNDCNMKYYVIQANVWLQWHFIECAEKRIRRVGKYNSCLMKNYSCYVFIQYGGRKRQLMR